MSLPASVAPGTRFPRYFRIAGHAVNAYKVFLCVGVYAGILASAAAGARSGLSPLAVGLAGLVCALVAMAGARVYFLAVNVGVRPAALRRWTWDSKDGGWSIFGGLVLVPFLLAQDSMFGVPVPVLADHLAAGVAVGGMWVRFGCVCNGCCPGRESRAWLAFPQHDLHGVTRRRLPAPWLEIAWWALACLGLAWLAREPLPPGARALAVLGWYGLGRAWLESLREPGDLLLGRIPTNQVVGALVALGAAAALAAIAHAPSTP